MGLFRGLLGVDLSKQLQSSDWRPPEFNPDQPAYAASDVLHLHDLRAKLDVMLAREGREGLARACFEFLPARAALDIAGARGPGTGLLRVPARARRARHCRLAGNRHLCPLAAGTLDPGRSEEHTSELQSLMRISYAVFCLKK